MMMNDVADRQTRRARASVDKCPGLFERMAAGRSGRRGAALGDGANEVRELAAGADAYEVSILEVVGSAETVEEVYDRESAWKEKLGTRTKVLNWLS